MKNINLLDINCFHEDKLGKTPAYYFNNTKHILDKNHHHHCFPTNYYLSSKNRSEA